MNRSRFFWILIALIGAAAIFLVARDTLGQPSGDDRMGQLFYLGILALALGAAVLRRSTRLSDTIRSFGLWVLIVLVLVAAYQYRYELQDIASRVTAGLVPGSPLSITDSSGRTSVVLEKLSNGHFQARARIDGRAVDMVIDTGATMTVLSFRDAASAGIDVSDLRFQIPVSTANGRTLAARVVLDEIAVGDISRRNVPALVAADGALDQSLLGMNFLGTLSGYDIRGDRLIMRD